MRVGVEDPVEHDLTEQAVQQDAGQRGPRFGGQARRGGQQRAAVEVLHHQHPLAAVRLVRRRHPEVFVPGGCRCRRHVLRLDPQVEFLTQRGGEALGQVDGASRAAPPGAALKPDRQPLHDIQVGADHAGHVRPAHLDGHPVPGRQRRPVHLGDRGGRDRLGVEAGELLGHRPAERGFQHLADVRPRHLGRVILKPAQLADELRRQQVPPRGKHLPELDEGDPAVLEGQPERASQPRPSLRGAQLRPPAAAQVGDQPMTGEYPDDLRVAARPAGHPPRAAQHVQRTRQRAARHQRLRYDQEDHAHQHRDDDAEEDEPQARQDARMLRRDRGARHRRDDRRGDKKRDERGDNPHQPAQARRQDEHGEHGKEREQRNGQDTHGRPPGRNGPRDRRP